MHSRVTVLCLLLYFVISGNAAATQDAQGLDARWVQRARWYYTKGHCEESIRVLVKLSARHPQHYLPYFYLGHCYKKMGLYHKAAALFAKAKNLRPQLSHIDMRIADCFFMAGGRALRKGLFASAIAEFQQGIKADTHYADNYRWIGLIYFYQAQYHEALPWLAQAHSVDPKKFGMARDLGLCYLKLGLDSLAQAPLEAARVLNPSNLSTRYNLGLLYARKGLWRDAWREFQCAVSMGEPKEFFRPLTE